MASLLLGALTPGGPALTRNPIVAGVLLALHIVHAVVWSICSLSLRQRLVPDDLLGRVGGASMIRPTCWGDTCLTLRADER